MFEKIDIYCERTDILIWSEPFNVLTNLAFIIAALFAARLILTNNKLKLFYNFISWIFVLLVFSIGIGSALFHTFANTWSMLADVIPISLFIILYAWFALKNLAKFSIFFSVLGVACIVLLSILIPIFTKFENGSYIVALISMFLLALYLKYITFHISGNYILLASVTFLLSLFFRSIDQSLCSTLPIGTHFLWHILNAFVLYLVFRTLFLNLKS
jgi:hypothetical protein